MGKSVITISSQYGSCGEIVAQYLSKELGIPLYDRQLFTEAACHCGIQPSFFAGAEHMGTDRMSHMCDMFVGYATSLSDRIFLEQAETIQRLADERPCIIVGCGGNRILKNMPEALHIYVYADMEYRKRYVAEARGIPIREAERLIRQKDRERTVYLQEYTGQNHREAENYHLCIDSGYTGLAYAVAAISKLYQQGYVSVG